MSTDSPAATTADADANEELRIPKQLAVLPVRNTMVLPGTSEMLLVTRSRMQAAIELATRKHGALILVALQRDPHSEDPAFDELAPVGCVARISQVATFRSPVGVESCHVQTTGLARVRLHKPAGSSDGTDADDDADEPLLARAELCAEPAAPSAENDAARTRVMELATKLVTLRDDLPDDYKEQLAELATPSLLADTLTARLAMAHEDRIALLCEIEPARRLWKMTEVLEREIAIAREYNALRSREGEDGLDAAQRERLLRGRMREIQAELGRSGDGEREADELAERIAARTMPEAARTQVERELRRFRALPSHASDRHMLRTYLDWVADLPWDVTTDDQLDIRETRKILDADHHALAKVKERILEYLAVRKLAPHARAPILCFVGPPGVGKTSLGRSIARAMGRRFTRASLGGVRDDGEIRGHRRTYVGAMPGRILQNLRRAGAKNPVFLLDEVDKIGADPLRGDVAAALLEVLDPEQNAHFSDHYLEAPFDLSKALFIATANTLATIPPALLDRMEVIELPGYSDYEKRIIARRHLLPKQLRDHGLTHEQVQVRDDAIALLVHEYTREAGVRNLDRLLASLVRKAAGRIVGDAACAPLTADAKFAREALGAPPHLPQAAERTEAPGVVVGLAATAHGGDILFIEATAARARERVRLRVTGQLGEVMRESAEAALSWVRANADALGLDAPALRAGIFHLHVPAGAVSKDGPSAGVALATALVSVLSGRRASGTVAMTGELTLRGRVLPVGGVKEKLLAAARADIKRVLLPRRNQKDLVELPKEVLAKLEIVPIDTIEDAIQEALAPRAA